nr:TonB-dependent receptor [Sediminibacterium sp.]
MKKIQSFILLFVLLFSSQVIGQQQISFQIKGVISAIGSPVAGAQIKLYEASDTISIKRTLSNEKGFFGLEAPKQGKYRVVVEAFGMEKFESSLFELTVENPSFQFTNLELIPLKKDLGNVTVTSKKPLVEQKIDRTIVNVEAAVTNAGNNVLEVLEKSPGITVDRDGNISLKGKSGVIVMVDGKPTQLGAADLANLLRNMNASQVEQIEIMTNPPAKYDAAGNAGIINLKTKKTKMTGFNGSITAGYAQGVYPKANQSVVANYRVGKFNVFGNYSYNYRERFQELNLERNFIHSTTKELLSTFGQETRMQDQRHSHNGRIGLDYFANKKTTWGILLSGFDNRTSMDVFSGTSIKDKFGALQRTTISNTEVRDRWKNGSVNVNFRRVLDSTGKEITADVDYIGYRSTNRTALANKFYFANGSSAGPDDLLLGDMPTLID